MIIPPLVYIYVMHLAYLTALREYNDIIIVYLLIVCLCMCVCACGNACMHACVCVRAPMTQKVSTCI